MTSQELRAYKALGLEALILSQELEDLAFAEHAKALSAMLMQSKQRAEEERRDIECFIADIPDAKAREILRLKYIKGYTWGKVGRLTFCDGSTARRLVKRYTTETKGETS